MYLSKDDILRKQLREELLERRDPFLASLNNKDVSLLPRLRGRDKIIKCKSCNYYNTCWNVDAECDEAIKFGMQVSPLDKILVDVIGDSN